jgi:hypothetical protein
MAVAGIVVPASNRQRIAALPRRGVSAVGDCVRRIAYCLMSIIEVVWKPSSVSARATSVRRWRAWRLSLFFLACLASPCAFAEHFHIVYPRTSNWVDERTAFVKDVIRLAMSKSNSDCTIEPSHDVMERTRALRELAEGDTINLYWASMSASDEASLRAIPIPLHRGLIGYRVFVIRKERQPEFDRIESLDQLKALIGGQGFEWVDASILRDAGLKIETSTYDLLFEMTEAGRIDYFPRGVVEAYAEVEQRRAVIPNLAVENHLLLAYHSDLIFYANKRDERLAQTIEDGLKAAYEDGSFMRLFNTHPYIQRALNQAGLSGRRIIWIPNRYLSEADRRIPEKYWMTTID